MFSGQELVSWGLLEASALTTASRRGLLARRSPLLRLQGDERLIALVRGGNPGAFEMIVDRYTSRLLGFCRQMLGSTEDAEDVLQEVFVNAYRAMLADNREINLRPWLYRIARNRCLNHLRKPTADAQESMDSVPTVDAASTHECVHNREEFRQLLADVKKLPETQRSALLLREMDAMSYEEIAVAMDTTVPSIKSLLVRARISLAEASQARLLTCGEVRLELAEAAEGLRKVSGPIRRHVRECDDCSAFRDQVRVDAKALAALLPIGPLIALKGLIASKLGFGSGATGAGAAGVSAGGAGTGALGSAGAGALGAGGAAFGGTAATGIGGVVGGAIGAKAVAGVVTAAVLTAGAVGVEERVLRDPAPAAEVRSARADVAPSSAAAPERVVRSTAQANPTTSANPNPPAATPTEEPVEPAPVEPIPVPVTEPEAEPAEPVEPVTTPEEPVAPAAESEAPEEVASTSTDTEEPTATTTVGTDTGEHASVTVEDPEPSANGGPSDASDVPASHTNSSTATAQQGAAIGPSRPSQKSPPRVGTSAGATGGS